MVASWNVGETTPDQSLSLWLSVEENDPDIISIGLQEIDMSVQTFFKEESDSSAYWNTFARMYCRK